MPLLNDPNNQQAQPQKQELDTSVPKPAPIVQQAQPIKDQTPQQPQQQGPAQPVQIQQNQPVRKGSGFTNLNRIMQANRGTNVGGKLGQGVTGQVQKFQQGVQQSQQNFAEEANKNRLDTP